MKTCIITFLSLFLFTTVASARAIPTFRVLLNNTPYYCDQVTWYGSNTNTCLVIANGKLHTIGYGVLQEWTGMYDITSKKIFEGDSIILDDAVAPNNTGTITWTLQPYPGWTIITQNGTIDYLNNLVNVKMTIQ